MQYYYVCSRSLLLDPLKDGWIDSLPELSTLGTSLKKPSSKGIIHYPRPLNDLKIYTTLSKKAMNRYTKLGNGLNTMNRQLLDSQGPIPGMTATQALTAIQTMVTTLKSGTMGHKAGTLAATTIQIGLLQS
ncbi:hypothetical protein Tco_0054904 [Tanacetum coccineum]